MSTFFQVTDSFNIRLAKDVIQLADGSLLVFSKGSHGPFRIDIGTRQITTVTLNGPAAWIGQQCNAATFDPGSRLIYAATGTAVYSINTANWSVQLVAGSPTQTGHAAGPALQARFCFISGLTVVNGNLLASDSFNYCLKLINLADRQVTKVTEVTIWPDRLQPEGLVYDAVNDVLLMACKDFCVLELDRSSIPFRSRVYAGQPKVRGNTDGPLHAATFDCLRHLMQDAEGTLLLPQNTGGHTIRYVRAGTGRVSTALVMDAAWSPVQLHFPLGGCILSDGKVCVTDKHTDMVYLLDTQGLITGPAGVLPLVPSLPLTSLGDGMWQLQQSGFGCDVTFNVGSEVVAAHKTVLVSRSSLFRDIYTSTHADATVPLSIPSTTPLAFKAVLKYLYTDRIEVANEDWLDVALLARFFNLMLLWNKCLTKIIVGLNPSKVAKVCIWAYDNQVVEMLESGFTKQAAAHARRQLSAQDVASLVARGILSD